MERKQLEGCGRSKLLLAFSGLFVVRAAWPGLWEAMRHCLVETHKRVGGTCTMEVMGDFSLVECVLHFVNLYYSKRAANEPGLLLECGNEPSGSIKCWEIPA